MRARNLLLLLLTALAVFSCWAAIGQPPAATAGFCPYQLPLGPSDYAGGPAVVSGISFDALLVASKPGANASFFDTAEFDGLSATVGQICQLRVPVHFGTATPGTCTEPELFWDTDDDRLHACTAADTWVLVGGGGAETDHGALIGLADDDHPQYALLAGRAGETVFNGAGADVNFRVEGSGAPNALFVDGANGRVGVGTANPASDFEVSTAANTVMRVASSGASGIPLLRLANATQGWDIRTEGSSGLLNFRDGNSGAVPLRIVPGTPTNSLRLEANGVSLFGTGSFAGGSGVLYMANAAAAPASNPSGGVVLYSADVGASAELHVRDEAGNVTVLSDPRPAPSQQTCDDSGDANPGALTVSVDGLNYVAITNSDADGCDATLSESGAENGQVLRLVVVSSAGGTTKLADVPGTQETGVAGCSMGQWEGVTAVYASDRWVKMGCEESN